MASTTGNRKRYRGRIRAQMRSIVRHCTNLVNDSKAARVKCLLIPAISAGGVYPAALLSGNLEANLTALAANLTQALNQKQSAGPTCLSEGVFAP